MAGSASDKTEILEDGEEILIKAPYSLELITEIKKITRHRWDPQRRVWVIPRSFEFRARKLLNQYFPPRDPKAWKEKAAEEIRALILLYLPPEIGVESSVIESNGTTTISIRRQDALDTLEEVNITVEDQWRIRESVNDDEGEYLAEKLFERQSCWLDFNSKPKPRHTLPPP